MKKRVILLLACMLCVCLCLPALAAGSDELTQRRVDTETGYTLSYVNASGEVTLAEDKGYASVARQVDEEGRTVQEMYYDEQGQPVHLSAGQYGLRRESFDDKGRVIRYTYLNQAGQPMLRNDGYATGVRTYDADGESLTIMYYDLEGRPAVLALGHSGIRELREDGTGRLVGITYLDREGRPMMNNRGYATIRYAYDEWGNRYRYTYYDTQGQPAALSRGQYGQETIYHGSEKLETYDIDQQGRKQFRLDQFLGQQPLLNLLIALLLIAASVYCPRRVRLALLGGYVLFTLYMTLLGREQGEYPLRLDLFWSYKQALVSRSLCFEIINNILLFIPLGALLYSLWPGIGAFAAVLALTVGIEGTQLIGHLGWCELDDIFNNALGGALGILACWGIGRWRNKRHINQGGNEP